MSGADREMDLCYYTICELSENNDYNDIRGEMIRAGNNNGKMVMEKNCKNLVMISALFMLRRCGVRMAACSSSWIAGPQPAIAHIPFVHA